MASFAKEHLYRLICGNEKGTTFPIHPEVLVTTKHQAKHYSFLYKLQGGNYRKIDGISVRNIHLFEQIPLDIALVEVLGDAKRKPLVLSNEVPRDKEELKIHGYPRINRSYYSGIDAVMYGIDSDDDRIQYYKILSIYGTQDLNGASGGAVIRGNSGKVSALHYASTLLKEEPSHVYGMGVSSLLIIELLKNVVGNGMK